MSALPDVNASQARLVAGRRTATSAVGHFDVSKRGSRGQKLGVLYVLVVVENDPGEVMAQVIIETIGSSFQNTRGSLTARLIRAVQSGSGVLFQDNLNFVSQSPRSGGAACAILRPGDIYLAQVGNAVAGICQQGEFSCLQSYDPHTDTRQAFGRRRDPDVRLAYHTFTPGDAVMLSGAELIRPAEPESLVEILNLADAERSLDNLAAALPTREGPALVLAMRRRGASTPIAPAMSQPSLDYAEPLAEEYEPAWEPEPSGSTMKERISSLKEGARGALATTGRIAGDWLRRLMPGDEGPYRGQRRPADRKLRRQKSSVDNPIWRWVALSLPVIVLLVVVGTYWKRGIDRQARYEALVAEVNDQLEIAATANEATARQSLESALNILNEADRPAAYSQEIGTMHKSVQQQLDTLNRVVRLEHAQLLHTFPATGTADQIIVQGADVYVLDRLTDRVYHHRFNETGSALESDEGKMLVRKGDRPDDTAAVGDLVGMVWRPGGEGGNAGSLLILGQNGQLFTYNPAWQRLTGTMLLSSETWQYPVAVSSYVGNFYILDPGLQQVLRYHSSGASYDTQPDYYIVQNAPEIAGAIDMAIDGFVYLLFQDGRLKKYLSGKPVPLTLSRLDKPVQQPSAIYGAPDDEAQFLYLADPANGRVLRCDKEGHMIQQFVIEGDNALESVRDIFVDEVGGLLYFLSDNQFFMVNMPPP